MGKTSLSRRFCEGVFSPDLPSVTGVEFQRRTLTVDGASVQLQVWNSGSTERHPSLLHSYYRASHGVVLAYDVTNERSFSSLPYHLDQIHHDTPPSARGLLLATKGDLARTKRAIPTARGAALAAELGYRFYEVSARDDVNVGEAFAALAADIRARVPVRGGKGVVSPRGQDGGEERGAAHGKVVGEERGVAPGKPVREERGGGGGVQSNGGGAQQADAVVEVRGAVRLHELTAPFADDWHPLITTQLLRMHRELRPQLANTVLASPASYLSLLQTICSMQRGHLLLAFHSPSTSPSAHSISPPSSSSTAAPRTPDQPLPSPSHSVPRSSSSTLSPPPPIPTPSSSPSSSSSSPSSQTPELLLGFALYLDMYDTFNSHRILLSDLCVSPPHRGQGVGTLLLSYIRQWSVDTGVRYITAEVRGDFVRCQPLLSRAGLGIQALSFIAYGPYAQSAQAMSPTSPLLAADVRVSAVDLSNFATQPSTDLLTSLEPIYRQLRPSPTQLPPTVPAYLSTLHHILSHGVFLLIAHTADGVALGVAACRRFTTVDHGDRLHVDDLVVDETQRSGGVGRLLMEAVKEEAWGGDDVANCVVTLESGTQRTQAHRFYWREGMLVQEMLWRAELK